MKEKIKVWLLTLLIILILILLNFMVEEISLYMTGNEGVLRSLLAK